MNYIGIDIHKKQCLLSALNEAGERTLERGQLTGDRATREVVGAYLAGDLSDTPMRELVPTGNQPFFTRVGLSRDDRTPSCRFDFHEPILLLMDFTLQRALPGIAPNFLIANANGERLFRSAPMMADPPLPIEAAASIPSRPGFLTPCCCQGGTSSVSNSTARTSRRMMRTKK